MTGPDAAFDLLSDPVRLPEWISTIRLEDSTAIEGEADADADLADRDGAAEAGFIADRKTRTISWGRPQRDYGGSLTVTGGTTSSAEVTLRLHTRAEADAEAVGRVVDQAVSGIRRLAMRR